MHARNDWRVSQAVRARCDGLMRALGDCSAPWGQVEPPGYLETTKAELDKKNAEYAVWQAKYKAECEEKRRKEKEEQEAAEQAQAQQQQALAALLQGLVQQQQK